MDIKKIVTDAVQKVKTGLGFHSQKETDSYVIHYPDHEDRTSSPLYVKSHYQLTHVEDRPCFICGIRNADKPEHPIETHHYFAEWSAMNGVDWIKFGQLAAIMYHPQTNECIGPLFDWSEVAKDPGIFVDSVLNLVTICKGHHVGSENGIHHVPWPLWILQRYEKDGFEFLPKIQ